MRLAHDPALLASLRTPTPADPLRVLVSGCITGMKCGVDGTDYGMGGCLAEFLALPTLRVIPFCPEDAGLGTPRTMPDIHGGDGNDVLDGRARVLDEHGADLTAGMIAGAEAMAAHALAERAELAILTDTSAACGTQVINDGCRFTTIRKYRRGVGVAAALLMRRGIAVVSQRDHRTIAAIRHLADPAAAVGDVRPDHHETEWYRSYFGTSGDDRTPGV